MSAAALFFADVFATCSENFIASASANGDVGGINIVASVYDNIDTESNLISKVLIHPNKIEMGAADIIMRGSNKI
jgi:hypothetical protein